MKQDLIIKLSYEGKIKRISIDQSQEFDSFLSFVKENYEELKNSKITLNYIDNERDTVCIENKKDFVNAIAFAGKHTSILRVYIQRKEELNRERRYSETRLAIASWAIEDELATLVALKCESCNRVFKKQKSFEVHANACQKVFVTKRTKFDSRLMRMRGIALLNKITLLYLNTLMTLRKEPLVKCYSNRRACLKCQRRFSYSAFEAHSKACERLMTSRVPFDSKKQRMICTNEIIVKKSNEYFELKKKKISKTDQAQWKKDSQRFRNIMKISRMLLRH